MDSRMVKMPGQGNEYGIFIAQKDFNPSVFLPYLKAYTGKNQNISSSLCNLYPNTLVMHYPCKTF